MFIRNISYSTVMPYKYHQWIIRFSVTSTLKIPWGSDSKESACSAGELGSIPRSGRSAGEGDDYPLEYSCLVNSMDRGAWQGTVHGIEESDTTE